MALGALLGFETKGDARKVVVEISQLQNFSREHTNILDAQARLVHQHTEELNRLTEIVVTINQQLNYINRNGD